MDPIFNITLQKILKKTQMNKPSADSIVERLQEIRLEETRVLQQLKKARAKELTKNNKPLHVPKHDEHEAVLGIYSKGDRVKIANRVQFPKGGTVQPKNRYATVVHLLDSNRYHL